MLFLSLLLVTTSSFGVTSVPPKEENLHELLEGHRTIRSVKEITSKGLQRGSSMIDVWSGSYWPHYQGSLAVRYMDSTIGPLVKKEANVQWKEHKENFDKLPHYSYASTDHLSPAEKYDLLVGDPEMTLTKYSWSIGEKNGGESSGKVPAWRGLCDGWASAAQMMPRPKRNVTLLSPESRPITFYPEDIKALGSLLYARAQVAPIFLGGRCRSPMAKLCADTNPATLHLALINRVGVLRKSFIADVSPGREVWNYPVRSYETTYYNVFSDEESADFEKVIEAFDKKKKFKKRDRRHPETAYIVGVKMDVSYAELRLPYTSEDKLFKDTYWYDLELNSRFEIVGGEAAGKLPDFIWAPKDRVYPLSWVEKNRGRPDSSQKLILMSQESSRNGQPLSVIVEKLFEAAK